MSENDPEPSEAANAVRSASLGNLLVEGAAEAAVPRGENCVGDAAGGPRMPRSADESEDAHDGPTLGDGSASPQLKLNVCVGAALGVGIFVCSHE